MNAAASHANALPDEQHANHVWLARILAEQRAGHTCLPLHLGLSARAYDAMIARHFGKSGQLQDSTRAPGDESGALREELLALRRDEWFELSGLLLSGRRGREQEEVWLASIVAAGCLGGNHLWRDLGLASRLQLRELLTHNFPQLAMRNVQDMRWKKFFYKQLCEQDGGHVCRAPSCGVCPTYDECYGEES
jgi:nitrogen fixation protein NifQ